MLLTEVVNSFKREYIGRYGQYKAHFLTEGSWNSANSQDQACGADRQPQDPPLLFNLEHDPGERLPLQPHLYPQVWNLNISER
jgi:hypothetical protein